MREVNWWKEIKFKGTCLLFLAKANFCSLGSLFKTQAIIFGLCLTFLRVRPTFGTRADFFMGLTYWPQDHLEVERAWGRTRRHVMNFGLAVNKT